MDFSESSIKDILTDFDLPAIKKIKRLETSGNITFLIKTKSENYLLRFSPLEEPRFRSPQEIRAEIELLEYLKQNNFPVLTPLYNKKNQALICHGGHCGYLRKYSQAAAKETPTTQETKTFGRLLGEFHCLIESFKTKNPREHVWNLAETKKNFNEDSSLILGSDFSDKEKFVERFEKEINALNFPDKLPAGTIHEDWGIRHVLWLNEKIDCVVDFDRCYFGKLVCDLGQACRGWCLKEKKGWDNDFFAVLIKGYSERRKLTLLEKNYLVSAIKFAILERSLSFCLRSLTGQKDLAEYARQSLFNLTGEIEQNRKAINKTINRN